MNDEELINALREYANADEMPLRLVRTALTEAADRIEQLSERIDIMAADMDREWGKSY